MAISGVSSGLSSPAQASSLASAASPGQLSQAQFLQLLTAQLQYQDPLNPVSNTDFSSQLAQLSQLQGIQQLNTNIQQMLQLQQLSQGATLLGKTVLYGAVGATPASGSVSAVSVQNGQLMLTIGGKTVPATQIQSIVQS